MVKKFGYISIFALSVGYGQLGYSIEDLDLSGFYEMSSQSHKSFIQTGQKQLDNSFFQGMLGEEKDFEALMQSFNRGSLKTPSIEDLEQSVLNGTVSELPHKEEVIQKKSTPYAGFSVEEIQQAAEVASLAYVSVADPSHPHFGTLEQLQQQGYRTYFFGTEVENSGIILEGPDGSVLVSYKGTSSAHNAVTDVWANWAIDEFTSGRYHNGFKAGFDRTKDQVFAILGQISENRKMSLESLFHNHVVFSGHSMGGALATVAADYTRRVFGATPRLISFAAPRALDYVSAKEFNAKMEDRALRVIIDNDPVPMVTPGVVAGAKHVGKVLEIKSNSFMPSVSSHKMGRYINSLQNLDNESTSIKSVNAGNFEVRESHVPVSRVNQVRMWASEKIEAPIHQGIKKVKDTVRTTLTRGWRTLKGMFG